MLIRLNRIWQSAKATGGQLSIDGGGKICETLEDAHHSPKIPGETRIPRGTYPVKLRTVGGFHARYLKRFGDPFHRGMLWIRDVPGFEYILVHCGNTIADTDGCVLVGMERDGDELRQSEVAYRKFYPVVRDAIVRGETVSIVVVDRTAAEGPLIA